MKKMLTLVSVLFVYLLLSGCMNHPRASYPNLFDDYTVKKNLVLETNTDKRLLSKDQDFEELAYHSADKSAIVVDRFTYPQYFHDDTWSGLHVKVDHMTLLQLHNYKTRDDQSYEAVLLVHFLFDSTEKDVAIYPNNSLLDFGDKQKVEATLDMGYWDGEILKQTSKSGYTPFFIKTLDKKSFENAKLLVKANYLTTDFLDHHSQHIYEIPLNFN